MPENIPFEKKKSIVKIHNSNHLPLVDFHNLKELQGDLKITTPAKIEKLKKSIVKYGIFVPKFIWIDNDTYYIEDGHQTVKALTELEKGGYTVPLIPYVEIQANDRKEAGEKLLMINSRFADINPETSFFKDFDIGLEFMEEIEIPELDLAFDELDSKETTEDDVPEVPEEPVTQVGDLWLCGKHRVLCGDATKVEDVVRLMDGKKADMVFTDPPYGVSYADKNAFLNEIDRGNCIQDKMEGDHQPVEGIKKLWTSAFTVAFQHSRRGASFYICSPQGRELMMMMLSILEAGWNLKQSIIWVKNNHVLGRSDYHYKHEPLLYGWKESQHSFYGGTGETTVWEIDRPHKSELHPTQKPVGLPVRAIRNSSKETSIIIDFFSGSGTTLIAAHQLNRICYGMEIEQKYVDVICQRFFNLTGIDPVRESDGKKWSELKKSG